MKNWGEKPIQVLFYRFFFLIIFLTHFAIPFPFLFTSNIQLKKLLGVLSNQEYILIPRAAKRLVPKALARFLIMAQLKKDDGIL